MENRRTRVTRASYFFTTVTWGHRPLFVEIVTVDVLRAAFREIMRQRPFVVDALTREKQFEDDRGTLGRPARRGGLTLRGTRR